MLGALCGEFFLFYPRLVEHGKGAQEEIGRAKSAGFERQCQRRLTQAPGKTERPRHAGIDLPADAQSGDAERLDNRSGGLAASDNETPSASRGKAAADGR